MSKISLVICLFIIFIIGFHTTLTNPSPIILQQTEQCFLDGQIPCRFLSDINHGLGYPYFIKESPLPYYLGLIPRFFGFSYSLSLAIVIVVLLIINAYLIRKIFFSKKYVLSNLLALFISFLFYYYSSPYLLLGLLMLFLINTTKPYLSSLIFAFIVISSQISTITFTIIFFTLYLIYLFFQKPKQLLFSILFTLLISSFYLGPMLLEKIPLSSNEYIFDSTSNIPTLISGQANISQYRKRSNFWRFTIDVLDNQEVSLSIPVAYYTDWTILLNQKKILSVDPKLLQSIILNIPPGNHTVVAFLEKSKSHFIFDTLTVISLVLIFIISFPKDNDKKS